MHDDARVLGLEIVEEPDEDDGFFEVLEENMGTVALFLRVETQWRMVVGGLGGRLYTGLDYAGVEAVMRIMKVKRPREVFEGLQEMESAALAALNGGKRSTPKRLEQDVEGQQRDDGQGHGVAGEKEDGAA